MEKNDRMCISPPFFKVSRYRLPTIDTFYSSHFY